MPKLQLVKGHAIHFTLVHAQVCCNTGRYLAKLTMSGYAYWHRRSVCLQVSQWKGREPWGRPRTWCLLVTLIPNINVSSHSFKRAVLGLVNWGSLINDPITCPLHSSRETKNLERQPRLWTQELLICTLVIFPIKALVFPTLGFTNPGVLLSCFILGGSFAR